MAKHQQPQQPIGRQQHQDTSQRQPQRTQQQMQQQAGAPGPKTKDSDMAIGGGTRTNYGGSKAGADDNRTAAQR